MAGVGVSRFAAEAKYSSEKERMEAPRTVVAMLVVVEKVESIAETEIGVIDICGLAVEVGGEEGRILSLRVSVDREGISIAVQLVS
jgi:hypothetical protein